MKLIMVLGYLGSGKTTFVSNALDYFKNEKNALIVNDFGQRDVDGMLLGSKSIVRKVYDGSIFCSCRSDQFVEAMLETVKDNPDNIIVEASGLANPYTMLRELNLIETKGNVKFDVNVFCLVDCTTFEKMLSVCHAVKVQIASSDVILINKTDLVDSDTVTRIEQIVQENASAKIVRTKDAKIEKYFGYPIVKKKLPALIEDLLVQKVLVNVGLCSLEQLDEASKALSKFCHRIKGIVKIDNQNYMYEYVNGTSKTKVIEGESESFLVLLSCMKSSLIKSVKEVIEEYKFLSYES